MNVNILEGLPISMVSNPLTSILEWKAKDKNFLSMVFDFGSSLIHDNGVSLLFYKDDRKLRANIRGLPLAKAYHFKILKEWTGINCLPITSAKDALTTMSSSNLVKCFILLKTRI